MNLMNKKLEIIVVAVAVFLLSMAYAFSQEKTDIPVLTQYVTDNAGVLTPDQLNDLNHKLYSFSENNSKKAQVVVLVVKSLNGESIEQYSNNVFHANKIGNKNTDNGVLTVLSVGDRKVRIEVGYGLEPVLTDEKSNEIIQTMTPYLKNKDYNGAFNTEMNQILPIVNTASVSADTTSNVPKNDKSNSLSVIFMVGLGSLLLVYLFYAIKLRKKNKLNETTETILSEDKERLTMIDSKFSNNKFTSNRSGPFNPTRISPNKKPIEQSTLRKRNTYSPNNNSDSFTSGLIGGVIGSSIVSSTNDSGNSWGSFGDSVNGFSSGGGDSGGGGASGDY